MVFAPAKNVRGQVVGCAVLSTKTRDLTAAQSRLAPSRSSLSLHTHPCLALWLCRGLILSNNSLSGGLPGTWAPQGFQRLRILALEGNQLTGGVPYNWSTAGAFQNLQQGNSGM